MKAVIFDADGTLLDSMPVWDNICTNYLVALGVKPDSDIENVIETMSFYDSCVYIINKYKINKTVDEMIKDISEMVADKYRYTVSLKDGAYEYVTELNKKGVKMCVVTASERSYITDCLKRLKIYDCMEFVMTCSEEGLDKNSYIIYEKARLKLGAALEDTLVFEDAIHAIEAATAGGYTVYGIYDKTMDYCTDKIKKSCNKFIYSYKELGTVK